MAAIVAGDSLPASLPLRSQRLEGQFVFSPRLVQRNPSEQSACLDRQRAEGQLQLGDRLIQRRMLAELGL